MLWRRISQTTRAFVWRRRTPRNETPKPVGSAAGCAICEGRVRCNQIFGRGFRAPNQLVLFGRQNWAAGVRAVAERSSSNTQTRGTDSEPHRLRAWRSARPDNDVGRSTSDTYSAAVPSPCSPRHARRGPKVAPVVEATLQCLHRSNQSALFVVADPVVLARQTVLVLSRHARRSPRPSAILSSPAIVRFLSDDGQYRQDSGEKHQVGEGRDDKGRKT
jgi:hypothetical protein